uniref:WGS project CBMI000000000 data, contig CS3069_c003648 n=1 Tax=Fusarium clavum TaxID=2594811 RepID=A0A090MJZ2_9HYPO|nr:unnamed protein product [Fusarium clavum]
MTWRGNGNTGNNTKTTRTMRTINTVKTSGDEYTARSELTETSTTVSGDDEDEQGEDGEQAPEEDDTSIPRFRSGELVVSKLVNLTRFHLDPRLPKTGQEQVHLSTEMRRSPDRPHDEVSRPYHRLVWTGHTDDTNGNKRTFSMSDVYVVTWTDGTTTWTDVNEWIKTDVKTYTDGEDNGGGNGNETSFEEEIITEIVTTNGNNGR